MKYLADVLTFFRFPASIAVFALIMSHLWTAAAIVFALAILSDAFDGIVARRWQPAERWYRKNPHDFDNAGDSLLFFAVLLGLVFEGSPVWDIVLVVSLVGTAVILFFIATLRPSRAEKLDVVFGWCFGAVLFWMLCEITIQALYGSERWLAISVGFVYGFAALAIIRTKWDRMTSRPEVTYPGTW